MRILYAASEVVPFAKTGGLGDVAGALPVALNRLGHDVKVVMPKYAVVEEGRWGLTVLDELSVTLAGREHRFTVWSGHLPDSPVEILFLANDHLFGRPGLYQEHGRDYPDNLERFAAFSRAVLEIPKQLRWSPDVLHANDWQTALTFAYLRAHCAGDAVLRAMGTVLTIHNLGYAGLFPAEEFSTLGLPADYFTPQTLEFYGKVNLLKAGLVLGGVLSTVSPTYSREIQTPQFGHGLEGILQARSQDLFGIVNGVDYRYWDPSHDAHLPKGYDAHDLNGKRVCKRALQKECRLPVAPVPLIGMISRLTVQKGVDLLLDVLDDVMRRDLQLVILGTGDPAIHGALQQAAERYPKKISVHLAFDDALAHRIEAGSDLFLMPSRYEPCGLNQLYSLRYGTIPIARRTGGLADTIVDATPTHLDAGTATGFQFEAASGHALLTTLCLALCLYEDRALWKRMVHAAMAADFSWERSARDYLQLYQRAIEKAQPARRS
jgi:starch synthase